MPEELPGWITRTDQPPEFTQLPPQFALISIARWAPHRLREIPALRELAPGEWFKSVDVDEYRRRYLDQLARLDPGETVCRIEDLARGRSAALLCWERPRDANFSVTFLSPRLRQRVAAR